MREIVHIQEGHIGKVKFPKIMLNLFQYFCQKIQCRKEIQTFLWMLQMTIMRMLSALAVCLISFKQMDFQYFNHNTLFHFCSIYIYKFKFKQQCTQWSESSWWHTTRVSFVVNLLKVKSNGISDDQVSRCIKFKSY